ncbi:glucokinase [Dokdonella fugitiva]|uniref:Glucokinase n=1 Tax=Dokdonella fugitiva TaxID=328517 RepID=A0A839EWV8_9GAMM|nr:glucokinase [Dokdonella fugitiva]MBA8886866.1 glucokinase [Dokdonella fugitiva]
MNENRYRIASRVAGQPLIAADVGGTHARIASIVPVADDRGSAFAIGDYCKYACADFPSLAAIIQSFRSSYVRTPVSSAALAIAGFVVDDAVVNVNLPWPVSISDLRTRLDLDDLAVVNDFKAVAYAVGHVDDASALLLGGPAEHRPGPMLVVGPGTGLGGAVHIAQDGRPVILATEVGQATLAATTDFEFEVLGELRKRSPRVLIEHVLSGTGLTNLYAAIRALRGASPLAQTPAQISAAALAGSDALASETVEVFCGWFGSVLGDLALLYGAQGGIYLAGGVLPQMKELLVRSRFIERFLDKGAMREALARTSIRLVDHAQLGVIGAASWYFDRDNGGRRAAGAVATERTGTKTTTD